MIGAAAGIERTLLSASLEGAVIPGRDTPLSEVGNAEVATAAAAHPDRFVDCFHVNPLEPGALATVAEYAAKGFKAMKLLPGEGWYPDDPRFHPFFDAMQSHGHEALPIGHARSFTPRSGATKQARRNREELRGQPDGFLPDARSPTRSRKPGVERHIIGGGGTCREPAGARVVRPDSRSGRPSGPDDSRFHPARCGIR